MSFPRLPQRPPRGEISETGQLRSEPHTLLVMRSVLMALLLAFFAQTAIVPLLAAEDCAIQESQHPDDDCSPLCVTCACSPVGHAFQSEIVRDFTVCSDPSPAPVVLTAATPDAPPRDILHVPLATSTR